MDTNSQEALEDGEQLLNTINFKPSFVLIAIDTHPSMFQIRKTKENTETCSFKDALTACYEISDSLILKTSRSNYNQFGVVLADNDQKASLIEVQNNLLESTKLLKHMSLLSVDKLKSKYDRQGDLDFGGFLLLCKRNFKAIQGAYYKRTLIYITNDDNPVQGDAHKRFTALNEAKTFEASDINCDLVTLKSDFDYTKFYNEMFSLFSKPMEIAKFAQDIDPKDFLVEKLSSSIVYRYTKLRYNFYPFSNDLTKYLKVMKVNFIRPSLLYNLHKASRDGKLLKEIKKGSSFDNPDPGCHYTLPMEGSETLSLDLQDRNDICLNELPLGLHLQYVSNRQTEVGLVINRTSILVVDPKEELQYFDQFWHYCAANDKVLVCIKKYMHLSDIRYVELIPKYANNQRLFLIKDIPFCNEINIPQMPEKPQSGTPEANRGLVRQFIDKLDCDYDPNMFINLSYGKKKAFVKAKLLEEEEEEVNDITANAEVIDERIWEVVKQIKSAFQISDVGQGKKRKTPASASATSKRGRN